jgi:hypothetical protein
MLFLLNTYVYYKERNVMINLKIKNVSIRSLMMTVSVFSLIIRGPTADQQLVAVLNDKIM